MSPLTTYVRWRAGTDRRVRQLDLSENHPAEATPCAVCDYRLGAGASVDLIAVGPEDDETARSHDAGKHYPALAVIAHHGCAVEIAADIERFALEVVPRKLTSDTCEHDPLIMSDPGGVWVATCKQCVTRWTHKSEAVPESVRHALAQAGVAVEQD